MNVPGVDFINSYNKYRLANLIGIDDWTDRLSYVYSFVLFLCSTVIVTSKIYLFRPIACHVATVPSGDKFKQYVESFCWVVGTIPLRTNETIPDREQEWEQMSAMRRINYYQWVPFLLGLQCIMFYLPRLLWSNISFNHLGIDLHVLISKALGASTSNTDQNRTKAINQVAESLEILLFTNRNRYSRSLMHAQKQMSRFGCFLAIGKRLGNQTVFLYFCIKLLYLINSILQLFLMKEFLGYDKTLFGFGFKMAQILATGTDWTKTLYFPRLAYCPIHIRQMGNRKNFYVGLCALPINMFNEKIYVSLYMWVLLVFVLTALGFLVWFQRLATSHRRTSLIRKYLYINCQSDLNSALESTCSSCGSMNEKIDRFCQTFLRVDGVFLIHILTINAGDIVTADVVKLLWRVWTEKYAGLKLPESGTDSELEQELHCLNQPYRRVSNHDKEPQDFKLEKRNEAV